MQPQKQDIDVTLNDAIAHTDKTMRRQEQLRAFVNATPFAGGDIIPLREDASVRRFFRVIKGDKTAIVMDARPPLEDTGVFMVMREKLDKIGLTVPDVYDFDHDSGLVIMEDFGDIRYFEHINDPAQDVEKLYALAVDALVHKYFADPAIALAESVSYSDDYWLFRVEQFLQHYMPLIAKRDVTAGEREDFIGYFRAAINAAHEFPNVLLHGDYGAQNLYYLPERPGIKALGLIDFQDMTDARGNMMGSPAFDLAFLLQDVRVTLPQGLENKMRQRFIEKTGIKDVTGFEGEYATIGAAQAVKCLGLFARLGAGQGRREYLPFIDICWRNLAHNWTHPALADIRTWFDKNGIDRNTGG